MEVACLYLYSLFIIQIIKMIDYYCEICDKSVKFKKNHLESKSHLFVSENLIHRYNVNNPEFIQMENILKNYINDSNRKFAFYILFVKWKLHFSDVIIDVKSNTWFSISKGFRLRECLLREIRHLERRGHQFSPISNMNIIFRSDLRNMIYHHYLQVPKSMLQWKLNKIIVNNPQLVIVHGNNSHPLIR